MQKNEEINLRVNEIISLDSAAMHAAERARGDMTTALECAHRVGVELDALREEVGAPKYNKMLKLHFSDSFRSRAKKYRKCLKLDDRQGVLGLGLVPDKNPTEQTRIKTDPFFGWINKINARLNDCDNLTQSERVACNALRKALDRAMAL